MKQCKNCSIDFEPKHETRGHEQLYCSVKCRMDAYKKRTMLNRQDETKQTEQTEDQSRISGADLQRSEHRVNPMGNYLANVNLEILEGKYQAKTEALEYKLRYENLLKELENAKQKIFELEEELDEYDTEGEEESGGFMGAIMDFAKTSPEIGNAIGKLLQNPKVQNFVINSIPDTAQNQ
jgi:hypothetical protein